MLNRNGSAARFARVALLTLTLATQAAWSQELLTPTATGTGRDGGTTSLPTVDGVYDSITGGSVLLVSRSQSATMGSQRRAAYEFTLPPGLSQPGVTITGATLSIPYQTGTWAVPSEDLKVFAYVADGTITLSDFANTSNQIWSIMPNSVQPGGTYFIDAKTYLQSVIASSSKVGFLLSVATPGTTLQVSANATLSLSYTVTPPSDFMPTVTMIAPTNGAQFLQGANIQFQAQASDPQDGVLWSSFVWTSSVSGVIATGSGNFSTNLPVGTHVVTATVTDSSGNSASTSSTISVIPLVNNPPNVSITSPSSGAQISAGAVVLLQGAASDPEQGSMSQAIQWMLDGTTSLGSGASLSVTLPVGAHTIVAAVVDSSGLTAQSSVNVNVVASSSYCSLTAGNASYEWIKTVAVGSSSNTSGSSTYSDFTSLPAMTVNVGSNSITLTPGFSSGSYNEFWSVWIDLNRNSVFDAGEMIAGGSGSSAVTRPFTIASSALLGPTRMRVAMAYGSAPPACGTISWGEVEDYTVNVQAGPTPPPPGPPAYCASRGQTSSMEWIASTTIAGSLTTTGNNGGYTDLTANPAINLQRGSNSLQLTAGYSGTAYQEQWMVWIDFNQNGVFDNEDWVYGNSFASSASGSFVVPPTAVSGKTRMRIQMKYGSAATPCESFSYGEVEDYSVLIP